MNLYARLKSALPPDHIDILLSAADVCADYRVNLFLVGGTVRDIVIGSTSEHPELDLLLVHADEAFPEVLVSRLRGTVVASSPFMTTKADVSGVEVDLVRARRETYSHPGALPQVQPGTIEQDLARRDFSMNALAISLVHGTDWGNVIDRHDGLGDLERREVRVIHPHSFVDDPTRIFRAVRYAARLDFDIEWETVRLLRDALGHVEHLTADRLRHEFEHIFREPRVIEVMFLAREFGVFEAVHPEFATTKVMINRLRNYMPPVGSSRDAVLLAALTMDASDNGRSEIPERLNMDRTWSRVVTDLGGLVKVADALGVPNLRPSQIHKLLRSYPPNVVEAYAFVSHDKTVQELLRQYLYQLRHVTLTLAGEDVIGLGIAPGPEVGRILDELHQALLDGVLHNREDEERYVRDRVVELEALH